MNTTDHRIGGLQNPEGGDSCFEQWGKQPSAVKGPFRGGRRREFGAKVNTHGGEGGVLKGEGEEAVRHLEPGSAEAGTRHYAM